MKVTMLLADHAQVAEGKLYISGGGWSFTGPAPSPHAVAIHIEVPWDRANEVHKFELALLDADGQPWMAPTPMGPQAMRIEGEFESGRPPGMKHGTALVMPVAVNVGPLPLDPDSRYTWKLTIDGESREHWVVSFTTRAMPKNIQQPG